MEFVIVTGMSGAGKSYAGNCMEDMGFSLRLLMGYSFALSAVSMSFISAASASSKPS